MKQETEKRVCRRAGCVSRKGFSFVEIILSTFILSIGISATFVALGKGLGTSLESQNVIIASGLAQEGTELVLNVRDNAFASGTGTDGFHKFPSGDSTNCRIDYNSSMSPPSKSVFSYATSQDVAEGIDCSGGGANRFNLYFKSGFYTHDSAGIATKFKRKLFIISNTASKTVYSVVYWGSIVPNNVADLSNCTLANRCVYAQTVLVPWN